MFPAAVKPALEAIGWIDPVARSLREWRMPGLERFPLGWHRYLLWLAAVEEGRVDDDALEPLPGIGPMTGALAAFADFFTIDPDLVEAAAERGTGSGGPSRGVVRDALMAMPDHEKTELLLRLVEGDPHVIAQLKSRLRPSDMPTSASLRTAGDLRTRAAAVRAERARVVAEKQEAELRRKAKEAETAQRAQLDSLMRRGTAVWNDVETAIERRDLRGYDTAVGLLVDLKALAAAQATLADFARRLESIRERHARKRQFIVLLKDLTATR